MIRKAWNHFKTICKHKTVVYRECKACGIMWQGIVHDLSKYSPSEFLPSALYFQGNRSPIEKEKEEIGYSKAWLHHKGHNPHHWEYWTDFGNNGEIIANKIPSEYVIEMVCDWIGAGKVYSKKAWSQSEPLNYYIKVRAERHFHPETEELLVKLLEIIRDDGLETFHSICRERYPLFTDYDGLYIP